MAVALAGALVAAACGNTPASDDGEPTDEPDGAAEPDAPDGQDGPDEDVEVIPVDEPGVTDSEIRVGGVASITNPLDGKFGEAFDGTRAYFEMVNAEGGVWGRELNLVAERDDELANNDAQVRALLTQDEVFAVVPVAALLFTGADLLVEENVPTFGWVLNPEWEGSEEEPRENLFGQNGSHICFDCPFPPPAFVADQIGAGNVGLLAYNVPQSANCAAGIQNTFERYAGPGSADIVFSDTSLAFGVTDLSAQVTQMRNADVDFVTTCMDLQGVITLAQEMNRQGMDAVQWLPNAYDEELLTEFGDLLEGSFVLTNFPPLEVEDPPEALQDYLDWIERTGGEVNENSMNGWLTAALFVAGLREAGPEFSRQGVIDAINQMTDWDADGLLSGVDWTRQHTREPQVVCNVLSRVEGERFVPTFGGQPDQPFLCLDREVEGIPEPVPQP